MDAVIALGLLAAYFAAVGVGGWMVSESFKENRGYSDERTETPGGRPGNLSEAEL